MEIKEPRTETGQYLIRTILSKYPKIEELIQPNATALYRGTISYDFALNLYALRVINRAQKEACESKNNDLQRNSFLYDIICQRNCTNECILALEDSNNSHILDKLLAHLNPDYVVNSKPDHIGPVLSSDNAKNTTEADTSIDNEILTCSKDTVIPLINSVTNAGTVIETSIGESEQCHPATLRKEREPILTKSSSRTDCQSDTLSIAVDDTQTFIVTEHNGPSASRNDEDERATKNDDFNTTGPGEFTTEDNRTSSVEDTLIEIEPTLSIFLTQSVNTDPVENGTSESSNDASLFNENDSNVSNPNKTEVVIGLKESAPLLDTNQGSQEITNPACPRRTWLNKLCLATLVLAFTALVCTLPLILLSKEGSSSHPIPSESDLSLVLTTQKEPSHVTEQPSPPQRTL